MGGGGGGTITGYTYSASLMAGICTGPIAGIGSVWRNKDKLTLADMQLFLATGAIPQSAWGFIETAHPGEAINYPGLGYIAAANMSLGTDGTLPNLSFEVFGRGMTKTVTDPGGDPVWWTGEPFWMPQEGLSGSYFINMLGAPVIIHFLRITFTTDGTTAHLIINGGAASPATVTSGETLWLVEEISQIEVQPGDGTTITLMTVEIAISETPEVATYSSPIAGKLDIDPATVLPVLLCDSKEGAGLPADKLGSLSAYSDYCVSAGLLLSPAFVEQKPAADHLKDLLRTTNSEAVDSQGMLKIVPYADETTTGNGVSHTPDMTPLYYFDENDFLATGEDPITGSRITTADAYNHVQIEYSNRLKDYNNDIAEAKDQADIEEKGLRTMDPITMHHICDPAVAQVVAEIVKQRSLYIRNTYKFKLPWNYSLLEPMDIVAITDDGLGLYQTPVRIKLIEEDDNDRLEFTVEEIPGGISTANPATQQSSDGSAPNMMVDPGDVNAPVMFEPPVDLCAVPNRPELWIAASGGANWGGAQVWVSIDGENYTSAGFIYGKGNHGVLTAALAAGGANPDTTNIIHLDMSLSGGKLSSATTADAEALQTLCYLDGELLAYRTAVLTSANHYNLDYLIRGAYGTTNGSHASGRPFLKLDTRVLHFTYPVTLIGQTVSLKFASFNQFKKAQQSLSDVTPYTFTLTGAGMSVPPHIESGAGVSIAAGGMAITYARTFTTLPALQITIIDQVAGDVIVLTGVSTAGFTVQIKNAGTGVARTINWIAQ